MAEVVSPGVFTNEKDLSFLPAGIAAIGAAIVGPTSKGPAFIPTQVENFNDFIAKFGGLSEDTYVPYAVKSYLNSAATVTVVRILQEGGYSAQAVHVLHTDATPTTRLVGVIMPTTTLGYSTTRTYDESDFSNWTGESATGSFGFTLTGSGVPLQTLSASLDPTSADSLSNVIGTSVKGGKVGHLYTWFNDFLKSDLGRSGSVSFVSGSDASVDYSSSLYGAYAPAATPYITSQTIGGQNLQLFKAVCLADGTDTNTSVKISIINTLLPGVDPGSDYGSFTILVRDYKDTDQRPSILESYTNLNLDPDSSNYISRRIGDRSYSVSSEGVVSINGDYKNVSKYIRIEAVDDVKNKAISANVKPFGFEALVQPISSSYAFPAYALETSTPEINGSYNKKAYYGWDYLTTDNTNWLKPLAAGTVQVGTGFNLDGAFIHPSASKINPLSTFVGGSSISGSTFRGLDVPNVLKFNAPMQGGFDGMDPAIPKAVGANITSTNLFGMNCSSANSAGGVAYLKGLDVISNADEYDINLIVTPGATIREHSAIINKAIEVAEDRGDCFVIADPIVQGGTVSAAVAAVSDSGIDSNYVATYWPWVKIIDTDRNKPVWVPPSVVVPRVMAYNDTVAYEWFAPAGLTRGGVSEAVDVELRLNQAQRNDLYENKLNAIATFPGQGICIWGQKTLQAKPSALDRINVRRLLITLKKFIASSSRYLVFENNTTTTRQKFINIVTPYLETVKSRQGLYAFRVIMDESNNTPDIIDRNIMYGQIYIQPAKSAEFIIVDFNILPTGASFENA